MVGPEPNEISTSDPTFRIVSKLNELFPMKHADQGKVTVGEIDKVHIIWARALRDILWLGCLSEAKRRRNVYSQEIVDAIDESLSDAFTIGKNYAEERP